MLQVNINTLHTAGEAAGLMIDIGKTKTPVFGSETIDEQMKVGNTDLEKSLSLSFSATYCLGTVIVERRLGKE